MLNLKNKEFLQKFLIVILQLIILWILLYLTIPLLVVSPEMADSPWKKFIISMIFLSLPFVVIYFIFTRNEYLLNTIPRINYQNKPKFYTAVSNLFAKLLIVFILIVVIPSIAFIPAKNIHDWLYWHPIHTQVKYTRLADYLKSQSWLYANEETLALMLKITNRHQKGWLSTRAIETFPCEALKTIDKLWVNSSQGKYGFSVQTQIWKQENEGRISFNYKTEEKFQQLVGWNNFPSISAAKFNLPPNLPKGSLPTAIGISLGKACAVSMDRLWFGQSSGCYYKIFIRTDQCKL
ncbi:MAG TPA: GUN4 domain-containing protein [Nostocaceae cyanobacterium]|nr:GUN4 domain-containing protein [Nostocaceae cyanobacterium]